MGKDNMTKDAPAMWHAELASYNGCISQRRHRMCNLQQTYEDLSRLSVLLPVLMGAPCVLLCVLAAAILQ